MVTGGKPLFSKIKIKFVFIALIAAAIAILIWQHKRIISSFYPLKYNDLIIKYSSEYGLDPYLVSALINVESHYNPKAQSHKDAKGLMQVTPQTGKWAAQSLSIDRFDDTMLFNPEINIKIGCWYLYNLSREFDISPSNTDYVVLLAAYNGGSGNVRKWLGNREYSMTGTELDKIPFKETDRYVRMVLINYKIYRWLYPKL
jgi:soluble lytic murein transglycosylase